MKYLSDYMNDRQTELFNKTGSFFAFSQTQFNEKRREGVKYVSLGAGLICPEDNVKQLEEGLQKILTNGVQQDLKENGTDRIIEREFFNYETQVTQDTTDLMIALAPYIEHHPTQFTRERINQAINACYALAVEKDLF